jgi:hypothetical protein
MVSDTVAFLKFFFFFRCLAFLSFCRIRTNLSKFYSRTRGLLNKEKFPFGISVFRHSTIDVTKSLLHCRAF